MKWQNLINRKCPHCGGDLKPIKDKAVLYECVECDFVISQKKYFEVLTDENHVMRNFLSKEESEILNNTIKNL